MGILLVLCAVLHMSLAFCHHPLLVSLHHYVQDLYSIENVLTIALYFPTKPSIDVNCPLGWTSGTGTTVCH